MHEFSPSHLVRIIIVASHVLWEVIEVATFASLAIFRIFSGDIARGRNHSSILIFNLFDHFNPIRHMRVGSLSASLIARVVLGGFELCILLPNHFITVFDLATLLMLRWVFKRISDCDVRGRRLEVNSFGATLEQRFGREISWLQRHFAILITRGYTH